MERETQPQLQEENSQKELQRDPPSGWRYYSPTEQSRWALTGRWALSGKRVLTILLIVIVLVSSYGVGYFLRSGGAERTPEAILEQTPWVIWQVVAFLIAAFALIFISLWEWLGLGRDGKKTGLDLLQFLATASIPIIGALGGLWFSEQRAQDDELRAYIDEMGNLLSNEGILESKEGDPVRALAQARTLTMLSRLGDARKGSVVQFLSDTNLIQSSSPVISLRGVDLSRVQLRQRTLEDADLSGANLGFVELSGASLGYADLSDANLSGAYLDDSDLSDAVLQDAHGVTNDELEERAESLEGATMPDGSVHD